MGLFLDVLSNRVDAAGLAAAHAAARAAHQAARPDRLLLIVAGALSGPPAPAALQEDDLLALDDLLADLPPRPIDLVLQSPGTGMDTALELAHRLRRGDHGFALLVPRRVRPGASLLAFLADEVWLGPDACVHPPTPTLAIDGRAVPADLVAPGGPDRAGLDHALAAAALASCRRDIAAYLEAHHGLEPEAAETRAARWTSTADLGLPNRALRGPALRELGVTVGDPAENRGLIRALASLDATIQATLRAPQCHLLETPRGRVIRGTGGAAPVRPEQALRPTGAAGAPRPGVPAGVDIPENATAVAVFDLPCECGARSKIQANLDRPSPLQDGHWAFPRDDVFLCPDCLSRKDLSAIRQQLEARTGRKVVA